MMKPTSAANVQAPEGESESRVQKHANEAVTNRACMAVENAVCRPSPTCNACMTSMQAHGTLSSSMAAAGKSDGDADPNDPCRATTTKVNRHTLKRTLSSLAFPRVHDLGFIWPAAWKPPST